MNSLSENLLIRSGELFKDFVTLPLSQFLKIKNKYNLTQAPTNINEFYDFNGQIDISIRSDKEDICDKILGDIKVKNNKCGHITRNESHLQGGFFVGT